MTEQTFEFRATARLLSQLGDQLIRNEKVAMLELIKNSYDADSAFVRVNFYRTENPAIGSISIYDEGEGMDSTTIRDKWLVPGTDSRKLQYEGKIKTERYKRTPLGEKGVGRFAVQKLGSVVEIVSRRKDKDEIFVKIDWNELTNYQFLDEFKVAVLERKPEVFVAGKTGTLIVVSHLSSPWDEKRYKSFCEAVQNFNSPFDSGEEFHVEVHSDNAEWDKGITGIGDYINDSLFRFKITLTGNHIESFYYEFTPPPEMDKVKGRKVTEKNDFIGRQLNLVDPEGVTVDLTKYRVGRIFFEGYVYDRDPLTMKMTTTQGGQLKRYLNTNGGVRVYRGGIRVYDYGELGNDWLELGMRRVNQPSERISNNIVLAAVSLDRGSSGDLIEKTNREGFIENDAYRTFKDAVKYALGIVETQRNVDKRMIRTAYGKKTSEVLTITTEVKDFVKQKVREEDTQTELLTYLDRIEAGYISIRDTFIKSANSGLAIGIAIHEIEKIVKGLMEQVMNKTQFATLRPEVKRMSDLIEGYGYLLRKSHRVYQPISPVIEGALFDVEYRLKSHNIEVILGNKYTRLKAKFSRQMLTGALLNILDNAIWWLDYSGKEKKCIFITVVEREGKVMLIVADNGTGFTIPTEVLGEPFISAKPDGIGLGLHIVRTVMQVNGGSLLFPEPEDFDLPPECKGGAILELLFNEVEGISV